MSAPTTGLAPTGTLRAAINLGNPVLARGTAGEPGGITVDLATELARRLDVGLELLCFTAARDSFAALRDGAADLAFLAVEPARASEVAFTEPYVAIEGVFVVPEDSALAVADDVDRDGVRVGVKEGSAYDLYLTRTLERASIERGAEGVDVFLEHGLEAGAGIRQPIDAWVAAHPGHRLLEPAFMQIRQAMAVPLGVDRAGVAWLDGVLDELRANGFLAESLERSGQDPHLVAGGS